MGRSVATSVTAPSAATRRGARISATQNEWVAPTTTIPAYAPSMYSSPWAKFITPSSPKRSEEHTSELQSQSNLVCRLLLEKKKNASLRHFRLRSHLPSLDLESMRRRDTWLHLP